METDVEVTELIEIKPPLPLLHYNPPAFLLPGCFDCHSSNYTLPSSYPNAQNTVG